MKIKWSRTTAHSTPREKQALPPKAWVATFQCEFKVRHRNTEITRTTMKLIFTTVTALGGGANRYQNLCGRTEVHDQLSPLFKKRQTWGTLLRRVKHIPKSQQSKQGDVTAGRDGLEEGRRGSPAQPPLRELGARQGFPQTNGKGWALWCGFGENGFF